jgi:uncharacterized protein YhaN
MTLAAVRRVLELEAQVQDLQREREALRAAVRKLTARLERQDPPG